MKKILDKLKLKRKSKILNFLLVTSFIGFIFGVLFIILISKSDQALISEYIKNFVAKINKNDLDYLTTFKNTLTNNILFVTSIWFLGISIVGLPLILFLYFAKTFIIGFSFSSFILTYNGVGTVLSLIYLFPHYIINYITYTILVLYALKFSNLLFNIVFKKKEIIFKNIVNKYITIYIFTICITIITTISEVFLTPFLFNIFSFITK
ncbi:MAG: stage II sporulation protein M [Bacilli bacterium]